MQPNQLGQDEACFLGAILVRAVGVDPVPLCIINSRPFLRPRIQNSSSTNVSEDVKSLAYLRSRYTLLLTRGGAWLTMDMRASMSEPTDILP
jgi:hypothetical protein